MKKRTPKARIDKALRLAYRYSQIDGGHHKAWVIDQIVRALLGNGYATWVSEYRGTGRDTYTWDEGIAP